jgi:murein L,D-transpeptidase YafK
MKTILVIVLFISSVFAPVYANKDIEIVIVRSAHELQVKLAGSTLRTFKVAFGSGGRKAKLFEGDHKTPLGTYYIKRVRSSDRFHLFLQINYPNINDAERALQSHIISKKEYQAILIAHVKGQLPPQNTALGGSIGFHGIGTETKDKIEIHEFVDWTKGCIAMRNHEIDELNRYIHIGTKVSIIN